VIKLGFRLAFSTARFIAFVIYFGYFGLSIIP
jgi:hypothetical protein